MKGFYENNLITSAISINKDTNKIIKKIYKCEEMDNLVTVEEYHYNDKLKAKYYIKPLSRWNEHRKLYGKYISYYESGNIKIDAMYKDNINIDYYNEYYDTSPIKFKTKIIKIDNLIDESSEYYEDGTLSKYEKIYYDEYKQVKKIKKIRYNNDGKIIKYICYNGREVFIDVSIKEELYTEDKCSEELKECIDMYRYV